MRQQYRHKAVSLLFRHLRYRAPLVLLAFCSILLQLLLPRHAYAGCGPTDLGACVDAAMYDSWFGLASFMWTSIDAPILQAAFMIDVFRDWLINVAFTSLYQLLSQLIRPLFIPFAVLAIIGGYIMLALMPLIGHTRLMNLRHVLKWVILGPVLLTASGSMIAEVEKIRVGLGSVIYSQVSAVAPGAIFGVKAEDFAEAQPLYGGDPCGTGPLVRPSGFITSTLRMDDLAAAMLWANAQDIHCPGHAGQDVPQGVPDDFYKESPDGPGYAVPWSVGERNDASERRAAIMGIQQGFSRLMLGFLPCIIALIESIIHLFFALALIALWIGLPFAIIFVFMEESSVSIAVLFKQGFSVLKTSWFCSFVLAVLFATMKASADQQNAGAYAAVSFLSFGIMLFLVWVGLRTVWGSVQVLNTSMMMSTGVSVTEPLEMAGKAATTAAGVATGVATGGITTAATALAAHNQTGSGRYTAGSVLGRIGPLAQVGEVAAAMGWVKDEELVAGLHAGQRSTQGGRSMRLQMEHDARRTNAEGFTYREAAQERRLTRKVKATQRDSWREINEKSSAAADTVSGAARSGYDYVKSGKAIQDIQGQRERLFEAVSDRWEQIKSTPGAFAEDVKEHFDKEVDPITGEERYRHLNPIVGTAKVHAAAISVAHDWLSPDKRYHAYHLDDAGKLRSAQPRKDNDLPADALTVANAHTNVPRLLRMGYTVQQNQNKTVSFWNSDPERAAAAQLSPNRERERLVKAKAVTEAGFQESVGTSGYRPMAGYDEAAASATPSPATAAPVSGAIEAPATPEPSSPAPASAPSPIQPLKPHPDFAHLNDQEFKKELDRAKDRESAAVKAWEAARERARQDDSHWKERERLSRASVRAKIKREALEMEELARQEAAKRAANKPTTEKGDTDA